MSMINQAADFILRYARLLERQRFRLLFGTGHRDDAIAALRAYQNHDGGFGNALEPDIRCPASQPVAAEMALRVLEETGSEEEIVARLCAHLTTITTPAGGVPFVLPSVRGYPAQPWWQADDNPPASANPTAAIVGLLTSLGTQHPWLHGAEAYCWRALDREETDVHTLLALLTFLQYAPDRPRAARAFAPISERLFRAELVALDPAAEGYVKKPLDWAPRPDSLCRPLFGDDVIAAHLDALAAAQQADGGWPISWPALSVAAEAEWRGWVTVEALKTLAAYGRLVG